MKTPPNAPRLRDYGRLLVDSWIVVFCATLLSAGAGWAVYANRAPVYTTEAQLFATVPGGAGTRSVRSGGEDALTRIETYAELARSSQVLARTAEALRARGSSTTAGQLANQLAATVNPGSVLLSLNVTGPNPDVVRDTANLWAGNLMQVAKEIEWTESETPAGPTGELMLVDGSTTTSETRGALSRHMILGAGLGAVLSSVLVLARGIRRSAVLTTGQLDRALREVVGG